MKKVIVLNIVFLIFITIHFSVDQSNGFIKIFFKIYTQFIWQSMVPACSKARGRGPRPVTLDLSRHRFLIYLILAHN